MSEENTENVIPTLEDLKNKEHIEEIVMDEVSEEMTASEYKKSIGKKVSQMNEEERKKYNALSQKKKREKDKIVFKEQEEIIQQKENNELKNTLYNQLFVLKEKFPEGTKNIIIDPDMSITVLEEKKALILQVITNKNAHKVVFESLLLLCRTGERSLNYFDCDVLDGYADEVRECEEDVVIVLKELIDMGSIDTTFLTPELRLMVIMSGCAVRTMEKNLAKKKVSDTPQVLEEP